MKRIDRENVPLTHKTLCDICVVKTQFLKSTMDFHYFAVNVGYLLCVIFPFVIKPI